MAKPLLFVLDSEAEGLPLPPGSRFAAKVGCSSNEDGTVEER